MNIVMAHSGELAFMKRNFELINELIELNKRIHLEMERALVMKFNIYEGLKTLLRDRSMNHLHFL